MTTQDDEERLLSILHAHGQQFLKCFDIPAASKRGAKDSGASDSDPEEEWTGFSPSPNKGTSETASDGEHDENDADDFALSDSPRAPGVMVFLESARKHLETDLPAKELRKSFMSHKVSNVTLSTMQPMLKKKIPDGDSDDERTNTENDALLHRLVHTELLSGSLNPELKLNHAQRGRALAGRVLELVGEAKLGKGESVFHQEQSNKAAKHVRDGLIRTKREQEQKALGEAKSLGNYHPTLKRLYDPNLSPAPKKRARGLGMGVGKFVGGTLKLSREEISSVMGSEKRPRNHDHRGRRKRPR